MKLLPFFLLLSCGLCFAQGVRFGDGQPTIQAGPVAGKTNVLRSLPNSVVTICGATANATPCTNKVTTYTDSTLAVACSTSTQLVLAGTNSCVGTSDSLGNWGVWLPAGQYSYTVTVGGTSSGPYPFTLATGNGGSNGVNLNVTGTTYTFLPTDSGRNVICQNASPTTFTLPAASTMGQAFEVYVENVSPTACTIVAPLNTIDGNSGSVGVTIPSGMGAGFGVDQNSNAPNYWTKRGLGFLGNYTGNTAFVGNMTVTGNLNVSGNIVQTGAGAWQFSGKQQIVTSVTVPPTSDFSTFVGSDAVLKCQLLSGAFCSNPFTAMLAAAFTQTGTAFIDVTGMGWPIIANQKMRIDCDFVYQESALSNEPMIRFTGPASPTAISLYSNIAQSTNGVAALASHTAAFSTALDNAGSGTATTDFPFHISIGIQNGANAGTVQLQAASHGAGTMTFQQGGVCTRTVIY